MSATTARRRKHTTFRASQTAAGPWLKVGHARKPGGKPPNCRSRESVKGEDSPRSDSCPAGCHFGRETTAEKKNVSIFSVVCTNTSYLEPNCNPLFPASFLQPFRGRMPETEVWSLAWSFGKKGLEKEREKNRGSGWERTSPGQGRGDPENRKIAMQKISIRIILKEEEANKKAGDKNNGICL